MRSHIHFFVLVSLSFLFVVHVPSCCGDREVEQIEKKSFDLKPGGTVKITADEGSVRVDTWERSEVALTMTKHARGKGKREAQNRLEEIEVSIDLNRDRLTVRELDRHDRSYSIFDLLDPDTWNELGGRNLWVDFDLTVPRETNLIIDTDEGDIFVNGVEGDVDVHSDEGMTELRHIRTDRLTVVTDEGDISLERIEFRNSLTSGRIDIDSDEGDIGLADVETGRIKIETDEGDVIADRFRCERLDCYSDEGGIDAQLEILQGGDYRCRTDEGEIVLILPYDAAFDITARTEEGEIRSDFRLDVKEMEEGERVDDTVNGGGSDLYLFTDEGDIRLRQK
jgi:hypothetical protein